MNQDTICAIATAQGGAIGCIRVSGPDAIEITSRIFTPARKGKKLKDAKPYTLTFGHIHEEENIIDEVLVSLFRAPHSYTGEDSTEIMCHGSSYILQKVLQLLIGNGCRLAAPGEYTQRAFLGGKMDLSQAEAVADLIASTSAATHRLAMSQMRGGFSKELASLRDQLLHFTSLIELELDFSDHEELEFADRSELCLLADGIEQVISRLVQSFSVGNAIKNGVPVAIIGETNAGKSTLLNMLGGLDRPSAGQLFVDGKNLLKFTDKDYVDYKRSTVGFVWQNNARNLVPYLTAVQNVELPMLLQGRKKRRERALELLDKVGLLKRKNSRLDQMSGGEQQRVAIAIALANNPKLLLADEPTGSVDTKTSNVILDIFKELNRTEGLTIVIVTHDVKLARHIDRVVAIRDGRTSSEIVRRRSYKEDLAELNAQSEAVDVVKTEAENDEDFTHEELVVLDRAGRLQLPKDYMDQMGLHGGDRVKVELDGEEKKLYLLKSDV